MKGRICIFLLLFCISGCDLLDTNSSTMVTDTTAEGNVSGLNMVLTSAYKQLYFNSEAGEARVYAGLTGLQMYVDLGGPDIICTNLYGNQMVCYTYQSDKTEYTGYSDYIWYMMYRIINQVNIILDNVDRAGGDPVLKEYVKGQALAIRGLCYFHLIQNYQQTYMIAMDKRGVLLRTSASDPVNMPFSSVSECYHQILNDLNSAKVYLDGYARYDKTIIDRDVVCGLLARVHLVMNDWENALVEASEAYNGYHVLMTRDEYRNGFDDVISNNYQEVMWAVKFTDTDNLNNQTQFNFWYNQDPVYGERAADGPIYSYLNFFADGEYEKLFEEDEDRYQFWKRTANPDASIAGKWAYDKYKHYGDKNGMVQGNTRPEISLMRGSEMLLIMAEASAHLNNGKALEYLNTLQAARGVENKTAATGDELLEAIYRERRKELLCEGVTGIYDLLRLQKPLIRYGETKDYKEGHYPWGLSWLSVSEDGSHAVLPSNDYRFICQIPQMEMANNNAIDKKDQNPFSGQ